MCDSVSCSDDLVLVDNLGYTTTGQVVNCNCQEVAAAVSISIGADKLLLLTSGERPTWFPSILDLDKLLRSDVNTCNPSVRT